MASAGLGAADLPPRRRTLCAPYGIYPQIGGTFVVYPLDGEPAVITPILERARAKGGSRRSATCAPTEPGDWSIRHHWRALAVSGGRIQRIQKLGKTIGYKDIVRNGRFRPSYAPDRQLPAYPVRCAR